MKFDQGLWRPKMRVTRLALGLGAAMIAGQLLAGVAEAQNRRKAPRINLTTALGSSVASNYIEPAVTLSEDAYVFVISIDVDRRVQVLHPNETGISVKMAAQRQLHLPRFFAGYRGSGGYSNAGGGYSAYDYGAGYSDTRGTMIALASRRPFRLSSISVGGDWDVRVLERLVEDRDPHMAATLLAKFLGAPGEPIGRDVHRFAGGRHYYNSSYYSSAYYDCGYLSGSLGYARGFSSARSISYFRAAQLQQAGFGVAFIGFDACGQPQFTVYSPGIVGTPGAPPPAVGAFPVGRLPYSAPRNPLRDSATGVITGGRPTPGRYAGQNDAVTPPMSRIPDAGSASPRPQPRPEGATVSERPRVPAASPAPERAAPRHAPPPPERVSTPRPVPERSTTPAYTPPPERSSPPPPPPRAEPRVERERPAPAREPKSDG
jgi:hypothetical protein